MPEQHDQEAIAGRFGIQALWRALLVALQLLTRIPIQLKFHPTERDLGLSPLCYPVVGVVIGLLLWLLWWLSDTLWPGQSLVQAAVLLAVWCVLTGGLHIDGLADSADAWVGGYGDRQRTLELLKDPTCGPIGVMAVVLVLVLKFAALTVLLQAVAQAELGAWQLLWAPLLARSAALALLTTTDYVRSDGMGAVLHRCLPRHEAQLVLAVVALLTAVLCHNGLWVLALLVISGYGLRRLMLQRLEGITGDTLGTLVELSEVVVLLALLVAL